MKVLLQSYISIETATKIQKEVEKSGITTSQFVAEILEKYLK